MKKFLFSLFFLTCIFSKEIENPIAYGNIIIEVYKENKFQGIVLVEKNKKYKGLALPGAILNSDETMEEVVCKKVKKSLNIELFDLQQFHVYSDIKRNFLYSTLEITHIAKTNNMPISKNIASFNPRVYQINEIPWNQLAFDHADIIKDYLRYKKQDFRILC